MGFGDGGGRGGDMVNVSVRLALGISLAKRLSPLLFRFGGWDPLVRQRIKYKKGGTHYRF